MAPAERSRADVAPQFHEADHQRRGNQRRPAGPPDLELARDDRNDAREQVALVGLEPEHERLLGREQRQKFGRLRNLAEGVFEKVGLHGEQMAARARSDLQPVDATRRQPNEAWPRKTQALRRERERRLAGLQQQAMLEAARGLGVQPPFAGDETARHHFRAQAARQRGVGPQGRASRPIRMSDAAGATIRPANFTFSIQPLTCFVHF
jgi:hypothetical protein